MGNFQSTSFTIVNRWGITVFETSDPQVRWDGTYQGGNQCPTGTYFYIATIHFTTSNGMQQKQYSGALELLR
jgi:gliding motility-associated-like protein